MASSIARARSLSQQQATTTTATTATTGPAVVDVVSFFSPQSIAHRRGSIVDDPPPQPTASDISIRAPPTREDEIRAMNLDEMEAKMKQLDRQPTQAEIDELLAEYDDDDDDDGSESQSGSESGVHDGDDDDDDKEDLILKILVVGNARCGKTSTIRRYVTEDFSDEYVSTIGADFIEKIVEYDPQLRLHLQLWDIAGQDRFAKFTRAYFRDAKGALIVCDITRENTIDAVVTWKNEIDLCCKDLNNGACIPVVMVANKSDLLLDPMGALNIGVNMQKCVATNGIIEWFRASAKSGEHIDEAFQCLLDQMVKDHRDQQELDKRRSTSTASDSGQYRDDFHDQSNKNGNKNGNNNNNDDIIRLSQYGGPFQSNKSDNGMCDCN